MVKKKTGTFSVTVCLLFLLLIHLLQPTLAESQVDNRGSPQERGDAVEEEEEAGLVFWAIIARNAAHLLPNYLGYLDRMNYPKNRIAIGIYTDHNTDDTSSILKEWSSRVRPLYFSMDYNEQTQWTYSNKEPFRWHQERVEHLCQLRQRVLEEARQLEADYVLFVDTDNFIINPDTLQLLIDAKKPIVAPMLIVNYEKAYSNFWAGQNEKGYYVRTEEYIPIVTWERKGCFKVPLVHSTHLVDLRTEVSKDLVYWPPPEGYHWDIDDIIIFSYSARKIGMGMYVLNTKFFGHLMKPWPYVSLDDAVIDFLNWKLKTLVNHPPLPVSQFITLPQNRHNSGLNAVYMINLVRRPERRVRMLGCLDTLEFDYTVFDAVDGRQLNESYIKGLGISFLPGWKDPWGERPLTYGEIGCFLSHYFIWLKVIALNLEKVLVLEDDVDFEPYFRQNLETVLREVEEVDPEWDLVYIGRKSLNPDIEQLVEGASRLVKPTYSYWTLGYVLSKRGAEKFLAARPFDNLLPVDEFFPIMYNEHTEEDWIQYFPKRDLRAYSAEPLLIYPTHYVGDKEWFSDTEPPVEELKKIREKKIKQEIEKQRNNEESEESAREQGVRTEL